MSGFLLHRPLRGGPLSLCLLASVLSLLLVGCANDSDAEHAAPTESMATAADDSAIEHAAKHLDPKYVCPMHPQVIKDEPGSCPICGMDLVEKSPDGACREASRSQVRLPDASANHQGRARFCPICGMDWSRNCSIR
jgi:Cu(I)/Ag(I) efflux system membrane fusion protein